MRKVMKIKLMSLLKEVRERAVMGNVKLAIFSDTCGNSIQIF